MDMTQPVAEECEVSPPRQDHFLRVAVIFLGVSATLAAICYGLAPAFSSQYAEALNHSVFFRRLVKPPRGADAPAIISAYTAYLRMTATAVPLAITVAVGIAWILGRTGMAGSRTGPIRSRTTALVFGTAALVSSVIVGPQHDYFAFLEMWKDILAGQDPWTKRYDGGVNNYGPLFNLLAVLVLVHPLAPKLLLTATWTLLGAALTKWGASRTVSSSEDAISRAVPLFFFLNPYFWLEIVVSGHFDVLVAACCVLAFVRTIHFGPATAGAWLGVGFLLKFSPLLLLPAALLCRPFGDKLRTTLGFVAVTLTGMGGAYLIWGPSVFIPLVAVRERGATLMSVWTLFDRKYLWISTVAAVLALLISLMVSSGVRQRGGVVAAALGSYIAFLTLSRFGFPQYFMIPHCLFALWVAEEASPQETGWLAARGLCVIYFAVVGLVTIWHFADFLRGRYSDTVSLVASVPVALAASVSVIALLASVHRPGMVTSPSKF